MSERQVRVRAPSNIAVVKYMGKEDSRSNLPSNGSVSLTLKNLATDALFVRSSSHSEIRWSSDLGRELMASFTSQTGHSLTIPRLDDAGKSRVQRHAVRVREKAPALLREHGIKLFSDFEKVGLEFCAGNTFPASSGIASSASSFAAITLGVVAQMVEQPEDLQRSLDRLPGLRRDLAALSREGSGSSCRSFEGPWVKWEQDRAARVDSALPAMVDLVVVVGKTPKDVSSSEAHLRVKSSPLWTHRVERVTERLKSVTRSIGDGDLKSLARETFAEMWEMHSLFHTSNPAFTYWLPQSLVVLKQLMVWVENPALIGLKGPLVVTMDAGPNLHCLVSQSESAILKSALHSFLSQALPDAEILEDEQGTGASILSVREGNG